jgi:hypothetical protein
MFDNSRVSIQKIFKRRRIMENQNGSKNTVLVVLLVIALIAIAAMAVYICKIKDEKSVAESVAELKTSVAELAESTTKSETENNISEESKNDYNANFSASVSKELGTDNMIYVRLDNYDDKQGNGYVSVNDKNEAHIYLSNLSEYSNANSLKKIADNVVNVWYCGQGQAPGQDYIVFSKIDGSVTCVRFRLGADGNVTFDAQERVVSDITNISNVVPIEGNDANGIGGFGVLFIKLDGTCYPYSTLDDLVK